MKYIKKDITTVNWGIIAHGVNCRGRMSSGVAAAIRSKWPIVYDKYREMYDDGEAKWFSFDELKNMETELYEDHQMIINHFIL